MGAIFGLLRLDGEAVDPGDLARMARSLAHCGPDGRETMAFDAVGLGVCLKQVQREDQWDTQPLHDRGRGITLVADIRLDNRECLAEAIGISRDSLASMADSALLLEAWYHWGEACVDHLIGDFTFALWDHRVRQLYLARDHMGQRGLFLHCAEGMLVFASEIKALWAVAGVPRRLDRIGFARRLLGTLDPDPGRTLYAGVSLLPGGCLRWFDARGQGGQRRYWQPHAGPEHLGRDEAYYRAAYRQIVEEAIACRVRRLQTSTGLLMSGGFDSGTIAAIAAPLLHAEGKRVVGVALVKPEPDVPLPSDARRAVRAFEGMPGLELDYQSGAPSFFSDAETHFLREDGPLAVGPMRRLAYQALGGLRLRQVIDGHGGDYTVNGLAPGMLGRLLILGKPLTFLREFRERRRFTRWSSWRILRNDVLRPLLPIGLGRAVTLMLSNFRPLWRQAMTRDSFARTAIEEGGIAAERLRDERVLAGKWEQRWRHMLWRVANTAAAQTPAAAHGLTLTRPFHDKRVVELGLALPPSLHFREGRERWLARTVFADLLPPELVARGPGNDQEEPGLHASIMAEAWQELASLEAKNGEALGLVDPKKIAEALSAADSSGMLGQHRAYRAAAALVMGRFADWLEPRNRVDQEP